jgi:hypothetical protein
MKNKYFSLILILCTFSALAQKEVKLNINHLLGTTPFAFNAQDKNDLDNAFKYSRCEYYISGISIVHDGGKITATPDVYILVDPTKLDTILLGNFNIATIEAINFAVGVDPKVNNNDPSKWPNGHPLAPKSPSMHWGWAAGYRFAAIEGKSGPNVNLTFEIHALGNKNYFKQLINVTPKTLGNGFLITLNADYAKALAGINISAGLVEHSEDNEAATCLRNFQTKVFTNEKGEGSILSVNDAKSIISWNVYPNPNNGTFRINANYPNAKLKITNVIGETIQVVEMDNWNQEIAIQSKGIYFLTLSNNGVESTQKLIVN